MYSRESTPWQHEAVAISHTSAPNAEALAPLLDLFRLNLESFLHYLSLNRNLSPNTLRAYSADLREFITWLETLEQSETAHPPMAAADLPGRFLNYLLARGISRASTNRKLTATKVFFKYLIKEGLATSSELSLVFPRPKTTKKLPDFLTVAEVDQLLTHLAKVEKKAATETEKALSSRNVALVEVLFSSGIRVAELVGLNLGDINWEEAAIRVLGKGDRERISFISNRAVENLNHYLPQRNTLLGTDSAPQIPEKSPLFLNRHGDRLTVRSVHRLIHEWGEAAGLSKPLHPHIFRHSFATHLLNHGTDLRVVQELLGHASIRSTQIYTHITTERLRKAYLSAHPRARV